MTRTFLASIRCYKTLQRANKQLSHESHTMCCAVFSGVKWNVFDVPKLKCHHQCSLQHNVWMCACMAHGIDGVSRYWQCRALLLHGAKFCMHSIFAYLMDLSGWNHQQPMSVGQWTAVRALIFENVEICAEDDAANAAVVCNYNPYFSIASLTHSQLLWLLF